MVEVTAGLKVFTPKDIDALVALATKVISTRALQTDEMIQDPVGWCTREFTNPANLAFDVCDGAGFIGFMHTVPTWRSSVYLAAWKPTAMRRDDLFKLACQVAFQAHDLLVIDAFIGEDNLLSRRAAERVGFKYRGTVKAGIWYNGVVLPRRWYELTRADVLGQEA